MPSIHRAFRRLALLLVSVASVTVGWLLLWHLMSPGVAANTPTGVLLAVLSLQMLPLCAAAAWWWDRAHRPAAVLAQHEQNSHAMPSRASEVIPMAPIQPALLVHRVIHAPRTVGEPRHAVPSRQRKPAPHGQA